MLLDGVADVLLNHPTSFLKSAALLFVYIAILVALFVYAFDTHIREHWAEIADTWLGVLLAPWYVKDATWTSSALRVFSNISRGVLDAASAPMHAVLSGMITYVDSARESINTIRQQLAAMRYFLANAVQQLMARIETGTAAVLFDTLKMKEQMKRSLALFQLIVYISQHSMLFMQSMLSSSVGSFAKLADSLGLGASIFTFGGFGPLTWNKALCFAPGTLVSMSTRREPPRRIIDVKVGDALMGRSGSCTVLAKLRITNKAAFAHEILTYVHDDRTAIATASHRIKYCSCSEVCRRRTPLMAEEAAHVSELVCLVTSDSLIPVATANETVWFADYFGTSDHEKHVRVWDYTLYALNAPRSFMSSEAPAGRLYDMPARALMAGMDKRTYESILQTVPPELMEGTVEIKAHCVETIYFRIKGSPATVGLSLRTIVRHENSTECLWIPVMAALAVAVHRGLVEIEAITLNEEPLYHLLCRGGRIPLQKTVLAPLWNDMCDFAEVSDARHALVIEDMLHGQ
jgi:hypothetical protein